MPSASRTRPSMAASLVALALVAVTVGCADPDVAAEPSPGDIGPAATAASPTTSPTLPEAPGQVAIVGSSFEPDRIDVVVGDTVTWRNDDTLDHWVLSETVDVIDSSTLAPGNSHSQTFAEAGTFDFFCNIHRTMVGSVVVARA